MHNPCTIRGEELVEGYKELEIGSQTLKILENPAAITVIVTWSPINPILSVLSLVTVSCLLVHHNHTG